MKLRKNKSESQHRMVGSQDKASRKSLLRRALLSLPAQSKVSCEVRLVGSVL